MTSCKQPHNGSPVFLYPPFCHARTPTQFHLSRPRSHSRLCSRIFFRDQNSIRWESSYYDPCHRSGWFVLPLHGEFIKHHWLGCNAKRYEKVRFKFCIIHDSSFFRIPTDRSGFMHRLWATFLWQNWCAWLPEHFIIPEKFKGCICVVLLYYWIIQSYLAHLAINHKWNLTLVGGWMVSHPGEGIHWSKTNHQIEK